MVSLARCGEWIEELIFPHFCFYFSSGSGYVYWDMSCLGLPVWFGWKTLAWHFKNSLFSAAPVFQFLKDVYSILLSFSKDNKNLSPSSFLPSSCSFQNKKWLWEPELDTSRRQPREGDIFTWIPSVLPFENIEYTLTGALGRTLLQYLRAGSQFVPPWVTTSLDPGMDGM